MHWLDKLEDGLRSRNLQCVGERKLYYPPDAEGPPYHIGQGTGAPCGECGNCQLAQGKGE